MITRLHGANPQKLYEALCVEMPEGITDFSSNTNALDWDGWERLSAAIDIKKSLTEYPDDTSSEVSQLLSENLKISPKNILVTNGSNEAIYLVASLQKHANAILQPVYGEYARALDAYGVRRVNIFDVSEIENLGADVKTIWLCNPCNPTGNFIQHDELGKIFDKNPDKLFILDEAYIDFLIGQNAQKKQKYCENKNFMRHNVIVLRSLTKIYHLCGARIGYVLSSEENIAKLSSIQPTWSVNAIAQQAAALFLRDENFLTKTRCFYELQTPRFMAAIRDLGLNVLPSDTNFFLVELKDALSAIKFLLSKGMVVRHTDNFPSLDGRYIRISTQRKCENAILTKALEEYIKTCA